MSKNDSHLELWAGVEATCNRVGDRYFDQVRRSGHERRPADLDRFAELGISALRYPVLWERTAPSGVEIADWTWPDERLARIRALGIRPIVGLLHHGSGPRYTDLLDASFPEQFAKYARAVAERYPWVEDWTPINEPLTTARFSALYGHWYPHARDDRSFVRALVHQCRASILAMEEIRSVNPAARLISTEDLGHTFSTPAVADQADFENERRWASLDLLSGRIEPGSPFVDWASRRGLTAAEVEWFSEHGCPPDIIGINHYPTSQRYLDDHLGGYPAWSHGGNGTIRYADVEAVRARGKGILPVSDLLRAAARRYRRAVAITECHIWSTREQQLRWLVDTWREAAALAARGTDVRAVTVWALLGTYDWERLVVSEGTHYEPGAFDLRGGEPRLTAIGRVARTLAATGRTEHPAAIGPRWWRSPERITFGSERQRLAPQRSGRARPLLITGATGTLGSAFLRAAAQRGLAAIGMTRAQLDLGDAASIAHILARVRPWAVVNAAGYVRVDEAEHDSTCHLVNAIGPLYLARACATRRIALVTFSTDLVFDGTKGQPYVEADVPRPLSAYGRSKALGEHYVLDTYPEALVIRTSSFFGPWDDANFLTRSLTDVSRGRPVRAAEDVTITPTYVPDLVNETLDLLVDQASGVWHLSGGQACTWYEFGEAAARAAELDARLVQPAPAETLGWVAPRPRYSALGSTRGQLLPTLSDALERYMRDRREAGRSIRTAA